MARPLRLEHPGALWHITKRGVEQRDIYIDDEDRVTFLDLLVKAIGKYRWRLHQYCLMTNHFHLLAETVEPMLSRGMQRFEGDYAEYFNRRYRRSGHLFKGRFDAQLVDAESYLLTVARYIVLNPVPRASKEAPRHDLSFSLPYLGRTQTETLSLRWWGVLGCVARNSAPLARAIAPSVASAPMTQLN